MRTATAALLLLLAVSASAAESRRQTIQSIVRLSRVQQLEQTAISAAIDALMNAATTPEQKEALQQLRMRALIQSTEETWISAYNRAFNDQTLGELLAFYRTPAASRALALTEVTLRETLQERLKPVENNAAERDLRAVKRTMADLRSLATAIEARATDTNDYPEAADMETLRTLVEPTYIRNMPTRDGWGHEYIYIGSPDKQHYRIVSAGADGVFEPGSRRIAKMDPRESERFDEDIIFQDGEFIQIPRGISRD